IARAAPAPFPERGFLLGRLSNAGLTVPRPAPRQRPTSETLHQSSRSKIYVLDSESHRDHDRRQPIEDRSWTSGIGCEASVSASTRRCSAKMKSTLKFCLN